MSAVQKIREIGPHLQQLRKTQGWTLDELARVSGVSRSMLSQIERGQANPTLATIWALADAFKLDIHELIVHRDVDRDILVFAPAQIPEMRSDDGRCTVRILSPGECVGHIEWYELEFEAGGSLVSEAHSKGSREHLTVIEGSLMVQADGRRKTVTCGSTARYAVDAPHQIENEAATPARAILVVTF